MARKSDAPSAEQKRLASMATDLSQLRGPQVKHGHELDPKVRAEIQARAERENGLRCFGCGARITTGFKFVQLTPMVVDGRAACGEGAINVCNGENGCDYAAQARQAATCVELIEIVWLDEGRRAAEPEPAGESEPRAGRASRARRASGKRAATR